MEFNDVRGSQQDFPMCMFPTDNHNDVLMR